MKRSFLAFFALVFACACSAFSVASDAASDLRHFGHRVYRIAKDWVVKHVFTALKLANGGGSTCGPLVALLKAKAFQLRIAKRERPELTGSWRMCPST